MDGNFIIECSTQYLTSEHREQVRCQVEHDKIKFVSTSVQCSVYYINNKIKVILAIFRRFWKIFRRSLKILQRLSQVHKNISDIFRKFRKISKDYRRLPNILKQSSKMFWSCRNKLNLVNLISTYDIIDAFTCEDIKVIFTCENQVFTEVYINTIINMDQDQETCPYNNNSGCL